MRWVKASERMPTEADADADNDILVRFKSDSGDWLVTTQPIDFLDPWDEWLEGALADVRSPNGRGNHSTGADYSTLGGSE